MKVLITTSNFGQNDNKPLKLLTEHGFKCISNPYHRKLTEDELIFLINEYKPDYLISGIEEITSKVLLAMKPYVKMISRCGAGLDGIDLECAKTLGILIANTPDAPTVPVAELTLGMILDLLRQISYTDRAIRKGTFEKPMGSLLKGKTVGLIGCGRIGTHIAKLLKPFECNIIGFDPALKNHALIELKTFDHVIKEADILSLHVPYTIKNRHIINKDILFRMKESAYLINVSRRGLVNDQDLIEALKNKTIAGAGIECYEKDATVETLSNLDNVTLTSHLGPYAKEARIIQEINCVKNILKTL